MFINRFTLLLVLAMLFSGIQPGRAQQREVDSLQRELVRYDTAKKISGKVGFSQRDTVKVKILDELSIVYSNFDPKKSYDAAVSQLALSTKIGYESGIVNALNSMGIYYETIGNYDRSLEYYQKALSLSKAGAMHDLIVHTLGNIGIHYIKRGIYPEALKYFHECVRLSEATDTEKDVLLGCYNNIGIIYTNMGQPEESLKYYLKSLKLQLTQKRPAYIGNTYNNIGEIYRNRRQYDIAMSYYLKGLAAAQKYEDFASEALNYSGIGSTYLNKKEYDKAIENHLRAKAIREKTGDGFGLFSSYICLGDIYFKTGKYREALRYSQIALDMVKGRNELKGLSEAYRQLSEINGKLGNYKQAYDFHQLYKKYNDSIFNAENEKKLVEQQMNFDFRQKEDLIQQENKKQKNLRNLMVAAAIALGFFAIFFLVSRHKMKNIREQKAHAEELNKLQQELHERELDAVALQKENENVLLKNNLVTLEKEQMAEQLSFNQRELASTTVYLFEKNKLLATLKTALDTLPKNILSSPEIANVQAAISSTQYLDADWDKFKQHFEKVHPDFFKDLAVKHPGLTDYEVRFCAYLHMKLSTKEIAALLNITPESVTKAKMRLNKKIKASGDSSGI